MPKYIKIESGKLLGFILNEITFVLKVHGIYLKPHYGNHTIAKGDIIVFVGVAMNECRIGLVRRCRPDLLETRIFSRESERDNANWVTVHRADVVCILEHCKIKKLWRLFMEEAGSKGAVVETTIAVTIDKNELILRRKNLESLAQQYNHSYSYHIHEVKSV